MLKVFLRNPVTQVCLFIIIVTALLGLFAPWIAPHDPYENNILMKFAPPDAEYWLGTDQLGRCVFSRMLHGEVIMRVVDVMLSFPSQIMILAVVALLGVDIQNVIIANIFIKWAWYARMIRTAVVKYTGSNFVLFSRSVGSGDSYIMTRHMLPCISAELAVLASLDTGWAILNISTLSFLGLGVQAPTPEWGAMLNEAKNVMVSNPEQMLVPGIAVVVLVGAFNLLGDSLRDALDPKEVRL